MEEFVTWDEMEQERDSKETREKGVLGLVSFNILSQHNLMESFKDEKDLRYTHASEAATWQRRLPALLSWLKKLADGTDVFALQEVDIVKYREDLVPALKEMGFEGVHQWDEKNEAQAHPWGVATFYRADKFRVAFRETRSRTLVLGLAMKGDLDKGGEPDWFVVNVHLAADSEKTAERMAQLSSTLWKMSLHSQVDPARARVVVLGDFNSGPDDAPLRWLLGGSLEGVSESHAFRFGSAYAGKETPTYIDPWVAVCVDHVAFTPDTADLLRVLRVPLPPVGERPNFPSAERVPLFSDDFPSDHYPIGCVLAAKPLAAQPTPTDPNACPLTPGQMRVLEFLEHDAPPRGKRGKPSEKELARIRAHDESLGAFTSHLDAKQRAWVAKWRKNYAKEKAKADTAAKGTQRARAIKRVMSFSGLAALFEASNGGVVSGESVVTVDSFRPPPPQDRGAPNPLGDKPPPSSSRRRGTFSSFATRRLSLSSPKSATRIPAPHMQNGQETNGIPPASSLPHSPKNGENGNEPKVLELPRDVTEIESESVHRDPPQVEPAKEPPNNNPLPEQIGGHPASANDRGLPPLAPPRQPKWMTSAKREPTWSSFQARHPTTKTSATSASKSKSSGMNAWGFSFVPIRRASGVSSGGQATTSSPGTETTSSPNATP